MFISISCLVLAGCNQSEQTTKTTEPTMNTVDTSASGLKREILKAAPEGAESPKKGQHVTVHYTGWLEENGKQGAQFDSSIGRGPFTFIIGVGQVIRGWDEGVLAMKVGEKARLTIPAQLGYGSYGAGDVIPPNATLIFDVELLSVK
jgi:FKBP-type peptidyl-prolyl cis-trans isomerase